MARGVNMIVLVGHLGDDPETKYTQSGMAITTCRLATTEVRKDGNGNQVEQTEWHRCKFFGKVAEIAGEYLRKGSQVYVQGKVHYDKYTGQDGQDRYYTDIIVNEMQMLGSREGGGGGGQQRQQSQSQGNRRPAQQQQQSSRPQRQSAPPPQEQRDFADDFADDDIPF